MGGSSPRSDGGGDDAAAAAFAPLLVHRTTVRSEWVDYNGHMSEWCYLLVIGDSSDAFFRRVGIDDGYRAAGASLFTVETHIRNLLECSEGDSLALTLRVLGVDSKRVHLAHEIVRPDGGVAATGEQMLLHVDTGTGRVSPLPATVLDRVRELVDAHSVLPRPDWVGHVMRLPAPSDAQPHATTGGGTTWTSR